MESLDTLVHVTLVITGVVLPLIGVILLPGHADRTGADETAQDSPRDQLSSVA